MMKKLLIFLAALMLLASSALAEIGIEETLPLGRSVSLCKATNCYVTRLEDGYVLLDAYGNRLSAAYGNMSVQQYGKYLEVQNVSMSESLNCLGLLDAAGKEILPLAYGDFGFFGDDWVLAYVLEPATGDVGEYKDSKGNKYIVGHTDVVYKGQIIGTLTRDDYIKSYTTGVRGSYLFIKVASNHVYWLDGNFNRLDVTEAEYASISEYTSSYKTGVIHNPTQTAAFVPGCTLTADQVDQKVWFDEKHDQLLDLQGNVIASGLPYDYAYFRGDYLAVQKDGLDGIIGLDGREIVPPMYKEISTSLNSELFGSGYNAVVDEKGCLSFFNTKGQVTAAVDYELSYSDYKGFNYNAPIIAVSNMGKYIIITATHGELPEKYEDFRVGNEKQAIIAVMKDGSWGCIDMAGNTVIPFEHRNAPEISNDGTLVSAQTNDRQYVIYRLGGSSDISPAANWTETRQSGGEDAAPVLNEGAWECSCGGISTGKFCPECGSPKPADEGWTCSCGAVNKGKFCAECGAKRPAGTPVYQCDKCGWKPADPTKAPRFCPECGDPFDENDMQ